MTPAAAARRVQIFAHRGGAGLRPENTLGAFRHALELGVDGLELDVRCSADKVLVISHDPTIDRTTDGSGEIRSYGFDELRRFDAGCRWTADGRVFPFAGAGYRILGLHELLDELARRDPAGEVMLSVDIKDHREATVDAVVELLRAYDRLERTIVGSFSSAVVRRYRRRVPGAPTAFASAETLGLLLRTRRRRYPARYLMAPLRYRGITVLTSRRVATLRERGVIVGAWTINDPDVMRRVLSWGVDVIISDRPELAASALGHSGSIPRSPGS